MQPDAVAGASLELVPEIRIVQRKRAGPVERGQLAAIDPAGDVINADRRAVVAGALLAPTVLAHGRVVVAEQLALTTFVAGPVQTCAGPVADDQMLVNGGQTPNPN